MRELGLETAGGNPGTLPSSSRMSAVSSEARRGGWGVLNQVLRPWTSCGCYAQTSATKRRHSRTKQPQSFGKNRVHGCSLLGGIPWVAITTACPWFQPKVCLGLYTELGEGDTPSLTPAESSCYLLQLGDHGPKNSCQDLPPGNHRQTRTQPLGDVALTEPCSPKPQIKMQLYFLF